MYSSGRYDGVTCTEASSQRAGEGDADEQPEDGLRGERDDPRPRERRRGRGGRRGGVDCHAFAIGNGGA